jgi:hypothetical protein
MPYFRPAALQGPIGDPDRETALQNRIQAIESDLERVNAFPSGKDSLAYQSLQGMLRYWRSVQNGVLANEIEELSFPDEKTEALKISSAIKDDLEHIWATMHEEALLTEVSPGGEYEAVNLSLFISDESARALKEIVEYINTAFRD